jgi:hypothetical protein
VLDAVRDLHNLTRWAVLAGGAWALVAAYRGLLRRAAWGPRDDRAGRAFARALDVQVLLGLTLYVFGPHARLAFTSFGTMLNQAVLRFFALEHPLQMVLALVAAQAGFALARKAPTDRARFRRAAVGYTLALLLILAAIPWPPLDHGRPLLPRLAWLVG